MPIMPFDNNGKLFSFQIKNSANANNEIQVKKTYDKNEILWLARIIYSETKIPSEMRLIGWVARNRVETNYFGSSYESIAKSPNQFSGLNRYDIEFKNNMSLGYEDTLNNSWRLSLMIAEEIYYADESARPFPVNIRHFYSPISVRNAPSWADGKIPYSIIKNQNDIRPRFAFYAGVK